MKGKKLLALVGMLSVPVQFGTLIMPKVIAALVILLLGGFAPGATPFPNAAVPLLLAAVVRGANAGVFGPVSLTNIVIGF